MVCAATNTTINEGDEVVLFYFINSLIENNPVYSDEKMETFFVPIEGTYDDYGFIEGVNERYYKESFSLINYYLTEEYQVETTGSLKEAFRQIKWNSKELIKKNTFGFQKEINYFFIKKRAINALQNHHARYAARLFLNVVLLSLFQSSDQDSASASVPILHS